MAQSRQYWLMKSEPSVFSIEDLARAPKGRTCWDGVRNYQARNFMRAMRPGDQVFFYHSNANPPAIAGIAEVAATAYPDPTQFERKHKHFDSASDPNAPRWDMVDIRYVRTFAVPISLDSLRTEKSLAGMALLQKGSRLSVQPVTKGEWEYIQRLAKE